VRHRRSNSTALRPIRSAKRAGRTNVGDPSNKTQNLGKKEKK